MRAIGGLIMIISLLARLSVGIRRSIFLNVWAAVRDLIVMALD